MASSKIKKICVMIGSRANYSSIKSFLILCKRSRIFKLQIVLFSSAILHRFGDLSKILKKDGLKVNFKINTHIEGENLNTMVKSTGLGLMHIPEILEILKPNMVLTVGDRYETLATTISSSFMNIPLIHTMGGEITGTIDEKIRHATTKFADIHFPASADAKKRLIKLGENPKKIFNVGCPRVDLVKNVLSKKTNLKSINNYLIKNGVGDKIDVRDKFCIVSYHPVTTEFSNKDKNISNVLETLNSIQMNTIVLWPNSDAGAEKIAQKIREFREKNKNLKKFKFIISLPTEIYIQLLNLTSCLVGNSSSGIREGSYIGTPVVDIGARQSNRERGQNVIHVKSNDKRNLKESILFQIKKKKYKTQNIYGSGEAAKKMIKILSRLDLETKKRMTY
tara:strand:+ start:883 stop:2061 length:1179 start_codon:yes stop_codon:yes gene_type:complete